ncbi:MAG: Gfo/Idh/MocA family oxidoreductase [Cyclobacteriaceae bacterium]|nr:Gfo/Idh/MocA family oxidoreductase [Cyclobacteriaceae bacterium]
MDRRKFIKQSFMAGMAASQFRVNVLAGSKNKKYRTVLIGAGWWGNNILGEAMASGYCDIVGICDADEIFNMETAARVEKDMGKLPKTYTDYRELLTEQKPEIAIIATPEHWHAVQTIDALKTGCHVYMEKPIAHTINEGKAIVASQKKYGKVIQVGLHRRTSPHILVGQEMLRSGKVGEIKMIKACVYSPTANTIVQPLPAPPPHLHWDLYLGPAAYQPFESSVHPRGFRKYLNMTNGTIGDWGVHWMDQILWWSEEKYPKKVYSTGGMVDPDCGYDAPDFQTATLEFENFTVNWEHRRLGGERSEKSPVGTYFYGTEGILFMGFFDGAYFYPNDEDQPIVQVNHAMHEPDGQNIRELWKDFIDAIEGKKSPVAGIESSHRATTMSLLAMISYKTGRQINWDGEKEMILDDPEALSLMKRDYRAPWVYPELS